MKELNNFEVNEVLNTCIFKHGEVLIAAYMGVSYSSVLRWKRNPVRYLKVEQLIKLERLSKAGRLEVIVHE